MRRSRILAFVAVPPVLALAVFAILKELELNLSILHPTEPFASKYRTEYLEVKGKTWFGGAHRLVLVETADIPQKNEVKAAGLIAVHSPDEWLGSGDLGVLSLVRTSSKGYSEALSLWDGRGPSYTSISHAEYIKELTPAQVMLVRLVHPNRNPFKATSSLP